MGNCLVTKLKGTVDNDNLNVLSTIKVHVGSGSSGRTIVLTGSEKAVIKNQESGVYFTNAGGTNYGLEATPENGYQISGNEKYVFLAGTGSCDVLIYGKYTMSNIGIVKYMNFVAGCEYVGASAENGASLSIQVDTNSVGADVDLGNIFGGSKFRVIHFEGTNAYLSVKGLPYIDNKSFVQEVIISNARVYSDDVYAILQMPSLTTLSINNSLNNDHSVSAENIGQLTNLTSLTTKLAPESRQFGAVETFVATQRSKGRTTCDGISWKYAGWCGATFNGASITKDENTRTLSWTATTITFDGVTINA